MPALVANSSLPNSPSKLRGRAERWANPHRESGIRLTRLRACDTSYRSARLFQLLQLSVLLSNPSVQAAARHLFGPKQLTGLRRPSRSARGSVCPTSTICHRLKNAAADPCYSQDTPLRRPL